MGRSLLYPTLVSTGNRLLLVLFGCLLLSTASLRAQEVSVYQYSAITDGLPSNFTKSVVQDRHGFIWIGTDYGLSRFDGVTFENVHDQLPSPVIKDLTLYQDSLFVITDKGISLVDTRSFEIEPEAFIPGSLTLNDSTVYQPKALFHDTKHRIWISEPVSIAKFDGGRLSRYPFDAEFQSLSFTRSFHLVEDQELGIIAVSQNGSLFRYQDEQERFEPLPISLPGSSVIVDAVAGAYQPGAIWLGTTEGLYFANLKSGQLHLHYPGKRVRDIRKGEQGSKTMLAAVQDLGILKFSEPVSHARPLAYTVLAEKRLSEVNMERLFAGRSSQIWMATQQGLMLVDNKPFHSLRFPQSYQYTHSLALDSDGRLLASSNRSLFRADYADGAPTLTEAFTYQGDGMLISMSAGEDELWAGTTDPKLLRISLDDDGEPRTATPVELPKPLQLAGSALSHHLFSLHLDHEEQLWMVFSNVAGLWRRSPDGTYRAYTEAEVPDEVLAIKSTPDHRVVVAGNDSTHGLAVYDAAAETFKQIANPPYDGKRYDWPFLIHDFDFGKHGEIWTLTSHGLFLYHFFDDQWVEMKGLGTLRPDLMRSIRYVDEQRIWVGTKQGLILYHPDAQIGSKFNLSDGLPDLTNTFRTALQDSMGTLWIGTNKALGFTRTNVFDTSQTPAPIVKQVVSQGLPVARFPGQRVSITEGNSFTIQSFSTAYPAEKTLFQYRMAGLDTEWTDPDYTSEALFYNMSPGDYTFEIRAVKRGQTASVISSLPVTIEARWYNTVAARLIAVFAFGVLVLFIVQYQKTVKKEARTREELLDLELKLQALLKNVPIILSVFDLEGRLSLIAGSALKTMGVDGEEYLGQHYSQFFSENGQQAFQQSLKGDAATFIAKLRGRHLETMLTPLHDNNSQVNGVIGVSSDITDTVEYEEALIQAKTEAEKAQKQAERANLAKSQFLANMSHELRTPMNAILGFTQILARDRSLSEKNREYVEITNRSGQHLLSMINDILDLSKIESGRLELTTEPFSLTYLIEDLENMLGLQADKRDLKLNVSFDRQDDHLIEADEKKLRQVMINLISNAIKYTDEGSVDVTVELQQISGADEMLEVAISDTGIGIGREDLERIFKPFEQLDQSFRRGTGLGLAITKRLIELMGGDIRVESALGSGTTFSFSVPVTRSDEVEAVLTREQKREITGMVCAEPPRVLVVDDVIENRKVVVSLLDELGFLTDEAEDGAVAIAKCSDQNYDLVLMDIVMPNKDGKTAFREIRKLDRHTGTPIFALTASGFADEEQMLRDLGFNEYIRKPFDSFELLQLIADHLDISYEYHQHEEASTNGRSHEMALNREDFMNGYRQLSADTQEEMATAIELTDFHTLRSLCQTIDPTNPIRPLLLQACEEQAFSQLLQINEWINPLNSAH